MPSISGVGRSKLAVGYRPAQPPFMHFMPDWTARRFWTETSGRDDWRDGRAVEGARLESVCRETYRGFESHSLRQVCALVVEGCRLLLKVVEGFESKVVSAWLVQPSNNESQNTQPTRRVRGAIRTRRAEFLRARSSVG